ncbi:LINE-1 type transposase domain-containing 1, partial [Clarias magur]
MMRIQKNKDKKDRDGEQADSQVSGEFNPEAFDLMTTNIIKAIDEKPSPLAATINKHSAELQAASKWLDKVEARIAASDSATHEPRISELEKQVRALTDSLDMAESYNRRVNIRVFGLAEDKEKGSPGDFFESWLP